MTLFTKDATRKDKTFWVIYVTFCFIALGVLAYLDWKLDPIYFDFWKDLR